MTPVLFVVIVAAISFVAGFLGSLLGLGGGVIVIPALTLLLHVDIRLAIGAAIVSVIATSSGAAAAYLRDRVANLRVAMFLEVGATIGAITGAYLAGVVHPRFLFIMLGLVLAYSAVVMVRQRQDSEAGEAGWTARRLKLESSYFDEALGEEIVYQPVRARLGLALMYVAGTVSGLLGIGSGSLKVPAMDLVMGLPIKVSTATSNIMVGVTAAASAGFYFSRGQIDPFIAAPVSIGVLAGAFAGTQMLGRIHSRWIRMTFVIVLAIIAMQMLWKGISQ